MLTALALGCLACSWDSALQAADFINAGHKKPYALTAHHGQA